MVLSPGCLLESLGELLKTKTSIWGHLQIVHYICIFKSSTSNSGDFKGRLRLKPLNFLGLFISGFFGCIFPVFYLNTAVICHSLMLVYVSSYVCPVTAIDLSEFRPLFMGHLRPARVSVPSEKHFLAVKVTNSL